MHVYKGFSGEPLNFLTGEFRVHWFKSKAKICKINFAYT